MVSFPGGSVRKTIRVSRKDSLYKTYTLYRAYDEEGTLLYVGQSMSTFSRIGQHSKTASWFKYCDTISIQRYETKEHINSAERLAIYIEKPIFNITHSHVSKECRNNYKLKDLPLPLHTSYKQDSSAFLSDISWKEIATEYYELRQPNFTRGVEELNKVLERLNLSICEAKKHRADYLVDSKGVIREECLEGEDEVKLSLLGYNPEAYGRRTDKDRIDVYNGKVDTTKYFSYNMLKLIERFKEFINSKVKSCPIEEAFDMYENNTV